MSPYPPAPVISLGLIESLQLPRDASIIDVAGNASLLVDALLTVGYNDVTVACESASSLESAKARLGENAHRVTWVEADVQSHDFGRRYDVWHDGGVLNAKGDDADRNEYLSSVRRTLAPGGHAIFATLIATGLARYRQLPVRLDQLPRLLELLAPDFTPVYARLHAHHAPDGAASQFLYLLARRKPHPSPAPLVPLPRS